MNAQQLVKYEEILTENFLHNDGIESRLGASTVTKDFFLLFDPGGKLCILIIAVETRLKYFFKYYNLKFALKTSTAIEFLCKPYTCRIRIILPILSKNAV
jgi:hypothetical protein